MSIFIVNSFQVPNALVDELMAEMSGIALKCYMLITRKTTGWGKLSDKISINQFIEYSGVKDKRTVYAAIEELEKLGLIRSKKSKGIITEFTLITQIELGAKNDTSSGDEVVAENVGTKNATSNKNCNRVGTKNVTGGSRKKCTSTKDNINTLIQNNINSAFEVFWSAGLPKVNKSKAVKSFESAFKVWIKNNDGSEMSFAEMLFSDIQLRIVNNQFGFNKLHPTTYLNNHRWEDEIVKSVAAPQSTVKANTNWAENLEEEFFQ